ncbi:MAG: MlaE family ABC transporter permease [Gammaproteobacteria bacterium]
MANSESAIPAFRVARDAGEAPRVTLTGQWTLRGLARRANLLSDGLRPYAHDPEVHWDLTRIQAMDSVGAFVLWQINERRPPAHLQVQPQHAALFQRWADRRVATAEQHRPRRPALADMLSTIGFAATDHLASFISLIGQFLLDVAYLVAHPARTPWREISATIYHAGARALGVMAIIGLLIGVVVSYMGGLSLQTYGAQGFIVNILGLSIVRHLSPVFAALLVAGRSGSAMTAELGVMRVTEELDALSAMGISHSLRLVLPKIIALTLVMPLLVIWTDVIALAGGVWAAHAAFDISYAHFLYSLPHVVTPVSFWLSIGKSAVFGWVIALIACEYGLRVKPNTESLSAETTNSVVTAITVVIVLDGIFAVVFKYAGLL